MHWEETEFSFKNFKEISLKDKWVDFHKLSKIIKTLHFLIHKGMQNNLMKSIQPSSL